MADENTTSDLLAQNEIDTISTPQVDTSKERASDSSKAQSFIINSSVNNGSFEGSFFEGGTFENWRTIGDTSIETKDIGIPPTDGEFQALITNGFSDAGGSVEESDLSQFIDLPSGSLDALLGGDATEGSGIKQIFNAQAGDILEFDFSFLTNEGTPSSTFNDSAFFSVGGFTQQLADTSDSTFSDQSVERFFQATETQPKKILIQQAGTYELGFGIVDLSDTVVDSGLLIDDVTLTSTGASPFSTESLTVEGGNNTISPEVDFILSTNGLEAVGGSSNTRQ
ncbi:MAG: hypothetical protein WBA07_06325 [Rivularia sp. (in: cyanobacteria)]